MYCGGSIGRLFKKKKKKEKKGTLGVCVGGGEGAELYMYFSTDLFITH